MRRPYRSSTACQSSTHAASCSARSRTAGGSSRLALSACAIRSRHCGSMWRTARASHQAASARGSDDSRPSSRSVIALSAACFHRLAPPSVRAADSRHSRSGSIPDCSSRRSSRRTATWSIEVSNPSMASRCTRIVACSASCAARSDRSAACFSAACFSSACLRCVDAIRSDDMVGEHRCR